MTDFDPKFHQFDQFKLNTKFVDGYWKHAIVYKGGVRTERWTKVRVLGNGAFGTVWLEKEERHGDLRAVKQIPGSHILMNFRELLALIKLKGYNEHFVQFFGWFNNNENIYLSMEYVEFGDLSRLIANQTMPERTSSDITRQLLEGLKIMHANGFCHRDLKPQNILVASLSPIKVKISDFGVSKRAVDGTAFQTQVGTSSYMAPEVWGFLDCDTSIYTCSADIWSLGCLIHTMIIGRPPFPKTKSLINYIQHRIPFPEKELIEKEISLAAIRFIKNLVMPQPKDRLSAEEALKDQWFIVEEEESGGLAREIERWAGEIEEVKEERVALRNNGIEQEKVEQNERQRGWEWEGKEEKCESGGENVPVGLTNHPQLDRSNDEEASECEVIWDENWKSHPLVYSGSDSRSTRESPTVGQSQDSGWKRYTYDIYVHGDDMNKYKESAWPQSNRKLQPTVEDVPDEEEESLRNQPPNCLPDRQNNAWDEPPPVIIHPHSPPPPLPHNKDPPEVYSHNIHRGSFQPFQSKDQPGNKFLDVEHNDIPRPKSQPANPTEPQYQSYRPQFSDPGYDDNETHSGELNARPGYWEGLATERRLLSAIKIKMSSCTDPEYKETRKTLHEAVTEGDHDMVSILLDEGADVEAISDDGFTPLHMAVISGQEWMVVLLLDAGADIDAETSNGEKPLVLAIKKNDKVMTGVLLDSGAGVHGRYSDGSTILHGAVWAGNAWAVEMLLDFGAKVNVQTTLGDTALSFAMRHQNFTVARILLDHGANINLMSRDGYTLLFDAIRAGSSAAIRFLLAEGADFTIAAHNGDTALHIAAKEGLDNAVLLLLEFGDNVRKASPSGVTPLHLAAWMGEWRMVKLLLQYGADPTAKDCNGWTPHYLQTGRKGEDVTVRYVREDLEDVRQGVYRKKPEY